MVSNRQAHSLFRNEVVLYLVEQGVDAARLPLVSNRRLSEMLYSPEIRTDIGGLDPWIIDVSSSVGTDFSTALNETKAAAEVVSSDWYVCIFNRFGYSTAESYAILPLHIMARILSGEVPTKLRV